MLYTQVELGLGDIRETWWLPVPDGKAKVGEKIVRQMFNQKAPMSAPSCDAEWEITQVGVTLAEDDLRGLLPTARIATGFERQAQTLSYMKM